MKKCLVCGNTLGNHHRIKGLLECPQCKFVTADVDVSKEKLERLYSEGYFKGEEYSDYVADREIHVKNFERKLKDLSACIGELSDKKAFEIGCAYGFFLHTAGKYFLDIEGMDISSDAVKYAVSTEKVKAKSGDYLAEQVKPEAYDVICMWDTIEHLDKPNKFIEKASFEIKHGGYICVSTGDIGSLNARMRSSKWRQIHPPTHLHYFSKKTLTRLLNNNGFDVVKCIYHGNSISIKNVLYTILVLKLKMNSFWDKIKDYKILDCSIHFNLFDYMYLIARKR